MDNPFLFAIVAFLGLMAALTGAGYRVFYKPGKFLKQLGQPVITSAVSQMLQQESESEGSGSYTCCRIWVPRCPLRKPTSRT
jgi:hypothetical protein